MKVEGHIDVWFKEKGYGFIHEHKDGRIVKHFVHVSAIYSGRPVADARVRFNPVTTEKGSAAADVEVLAAL